MRINELSQVKEVLLVKELDPDVVDMSKEFKLPYDLVLKMYNARDKEKMLFQWVKTGHVDFKTFQKLLTYIAES